MNLHVDERAIQAIGNVLNNHERPLKERFRALFTLRNLGGKIAIECIANCFSDPSALLKHECAYCLGQMQDPISIPVLTEVLKDKSQEPMVRHEAVVAGLSEELKLLHAKSKGAKKRNRAKNLENNVFKGKNGLGFRLSNWFQALVSDEGEQ
ncbi:deoxyhypusine hydroxylase-like, partial [Limulus polyphemus]|uniref:Deoxyhypusine hydroxylase-like n=1 Tax=Limulus polyphemus TaxID=6850 RepID=A0ABM1C3Q8_LIMPO